MLFQFEFTGIWIAISIILFPIGIYVMRWYARKKYIKDKMIIEKTYPILEWDTSLKTALVINLIWLVISIPIGILLNLMLAQNLFLYLLILYCSNIVINIIIGTITVRKVYKKDLGESFNYVAIIQLILFGVGLTLGFAFSLILGYIDPKISKIIFYILEKGLLYTLILTALGLLIGFILGISLALMRVYGGKELVWLSSGYEKLFRGIPILILIMIFVYGMPQIFWYVDLLNRRLAGVILALALRSGAYQSQILRGAILSVNPGQMEAARSMGMSGFQAFRHVVFPQALRLAVPSWSNEYAVVIKDSSFTYVVGIVEMSQAAYNLTLVYRGENALLYGILALIYLFFTYPVTKLFGERQEKKLKALGMGGG